MTIKPSLSEDQFVNMAFITHLTGLTDKWFYKLIKDGEFPAPIKFGRSSRWRQSEVEARYRPALMHPGREFRHGNDPQTYRNSRGGVVMKTPYSRHDFLLQHYQRWLDDFTRLAVRHGLCHPNIRASHQLTIGSLRFTGTGQVTAVVPHALYRLFCGNPPVITVAEDMSTRLDSDTTLLLHHPMLEGILLSECA